MPNYVSNFGVKNYSNQTIIPQLIANNIVGVSAETRRTVELTVWYDTA